MHEHRAEADRRAVHEDEFTGRDDAAERPELAMDAPGDLGAVEAALRILDALDLVAEQRRIDELGPDLERVAHRRPEIAESPGPVGMARAGSGERRVGKECVSPCR